AQARTNKNKTVVLQVVDTPPEPPKNPPKIVNNRKALNAGSILKTDKNSFVVERTLAAGESGHVYKVSVLGKEKQVYALKTE
ncbi:hypothetical protein PMAYCL1PPCAC_02262, partial [Pristionchus mayeri]